jgi:hypothetical protein
MGFLRVKRSSGPLERIPSGRDQVARAAPFE